MASQSANIEEASGRADPGEQSVVNGVGGGGTLVGQPAPEVTRPDASADLGRDEPRTAVQSSAAKPVETASSVAESAPNSLTESDTEAAAVKPEEGEEGEEGNVGVENPAAPPAASGEPPQSGAVAEQAVHASSDDFGHDFFGDGQARQSAPAGQRASGELDDSIAPPKPMSRESRRAMLASIGMLVFSVLVIGGYWLYHKLWLPTPVELGGLTPVSLDSLRLAESPAHVAAPGTGVVSGARPVPTESETPTGEESVAGEASASEVTVPVDNLGGVEDVSDADGVEAVGAVDSPSDDGVAASAVPAGESEQADTGADSETVGVPAPAVAESEAVAEPETTAATEAVVEPEANAEAEAVVEPEANAEAEAVVEPEANSEAEAALEAEPVAEPAPAAAPPAPEPAAPAAAASEPEPSHAALLSQARRAQASGKHGQALELYRLALSARPGSSKALSGIALQQLNLGRPVEARDYAERAAAANVKNAEAWIVLGAVLQADQDVAGAREAYQKCAALNDRNYSVECQRLAR